MKRTLLISLALLSLTTSSFAMSFGNINTTVAGEFLTASNKPLVAQLNLLQQTFQVHFPISVINVGQAANFLLQTTGYKLLMNKADYPNAYKMLHRPLPLVDRNFGPMTLQKGLETLASNHFQLLVDPVNRIVSFRLKPSLAQAFNN